MAVTSRPAQQRRGGGRWWALAAFLAAVTVAAGIGVAGVSGTTEEYAALQRPGWAPPSWLFGPVWTVLYGMVAVAGWLAWRRAGLGPALAAWTAQLVLNAAWTPLFFGAGQYGLAFLDIAVLWLLVSLTVALFRRVSTPATLLLLPYWLWVTYAAALNLAIWQLNT